MLDYNDLIGKTGSFKHQSIAPKKEQNISSPSVNPVFRNVYELFKTDLYKAIYIFCLISSRNPELEYLGQELEKTGGKVIQDMLSNIEAITPAKRAKLLEDGIMDFEDHEATVLLARGIYKASPFMREELGLQLSWEEWAWISGESEEHFLE